MQRQTDAGRNAGRQQKVQVVAEQQKARVCATEPRVSVPLPAYGRHEKSSRRSIRPPRMAAGDQTGRSSDGGRTAAQGVPQKRRRRKRSPPSHAENRYQQQSAGAQAIYLLQ